MRYCSRWTSCTNRRAFAQLRSKPSTVREVSGVARSRCRAVEVAAAGTGRTCPGRPTVALPIPMLLMRAGRTLVRAGNARERDESAARTARRRHAEGGQERGRGARKGARRGGEERGVGGAGGRTLWPGMAGGGGGGEGGREEGGGAREANRLGAARDLRRARASPPPPSPSYPSPPCPSGPCTPAAPGSTTRDSNSGPRSGGQCTGMHHPPPPPPGVPPEVAPPRAAVGSPALLLAKSSACVQMDGSGLILPQLYVHLMIHNY